MLAVLLHSTMSAPVSRTDGNDHPLWVNPCSLDDSVASRGEITAEDIRSLLDAVANRARVANEEADKAKRKFVSTRSSSLCPEVRNASPEAFLISPALC